MFPALIITPNNKLMNNVLLVTGAMQGNYISEEIVEWLRAQGVQSKRCLTTICSAFKEERCIESNNNYTFQLTLLSKHASNCVSLEISASTINTSYEVIIGVPTIRKHNMIDLLAYR